MRGETSSTWHEQVQLPQLNLPTSRPLRSGAAPSIYFLPPPIEHSAGPVPPAPLLCSLWGRLANTRGQLSSLSSRFPSLPSSPAGAQASSRLPLSRPAGRAATLSSPQPAAICQWRLWLVLVTQWPSAVCSCSSSSSFENITSRDQMCCNSP